MENILNKVQFFLLIALASTMPFNIEDVNINGSIIILLSANALIRLILIRDFKPFLNKLFIGFALFYLVHLIGFLYSTNTSEAGLIIERKLSLIAFPVILFSGPKFSLEQFKKILLSFVVSNLIVGVVCLAMSAANYLASGDSGVFFYHTLSINTGMHAAYLSMYFCFSLAILLYVYYSEARSFSTFYKLMYWLAVAFFAILIIMLSSRTQTVAMMLGITIYSVYRFGWNKNKVKLISGSTLIVVIMMGLILLFPKSRERFKEAINYNGEYALNKKWGDKQMRYLIWGSTFQLIAEKPIVGWGTGNVQEELQRIYIEKEYVSLTYFTNTRFNAHNQFFETAIALGTIGLLIFLSGIVLAWKYATRNKNHLYIIFICLFIVSCTTESMLERQNGVVFFAFFNSLVLLNASKQHGDDEAIKAEL